MILISLVLFAGGALLLPAQVHVERSIEIQRPVSTVYTIVNGFESFAAWSPRLVRDPAMQYQVSGPDSGAGARLEWQGDPRQVGSGWQEITYSEPYRLIKTDVQSEQQSIYRTYFHMENVAGGVRLTWGLDTDLTSGQGFAGSILARWFGLFFDRWIGSDFETGLQGLKTWIETLPGADFSGLEAGLVEVEPVDVLHAESHGDLAAAYQAISSFMALNGIERAGQPIAVTRFGDKKNFQLSAEVPVLRTDAPAGGDVKWGTSPAGWAARAVHRGSYDALPATYEKLAAWMAAHGYSEGQLSWEHYISDPGDTAVDDLVTHVYFQLDTPPRE